jgi:Pyruvate/2-oxoacid:ferredoxin oxidoreductase delta subunit
MASRREANREMTNPQFVKNLQLLFPELETIPHNDSLKRLLEKIDVSQIEQAHIELIRRLIKNKKFYRYLINHSYPIAIDGTQKFKRDEIWSEECSGRTVGKGNTAQPQYYVYVLEASLAFHNGMVIPLMSEFLEYTAGDTSEKKEDCEQKAFKRLAARLKKEFKRLRIMLLLDGLYPNGPIMEICRKNKWDFMIVLQDKSLRSVWEEFYGLRQLQTEQKTNMKWGDRRQEFEWVNNIEYYYGSNEEKKIVLHVVTCKESWEEVDKSSGKIITKSSRHAWISSKPLTKENIHERCNLAARYRWCIETNILIEKHHGYQYEHCFSYDWNAMKGYHYLMRLAHLFNVLAEYSESMVSYIKRTGIRNLIRFIRNTLTGPWLQGDITKRIMAPCQLRLL